MINIDLQRNEYGFYILDKKALAHLNGARIIDPETGKPTDNLKLEHEGSEIFAKVYNSNGGMMSLYGEILFAQFCEMNNLPCAEIDVAIYDGKPVVLSKSVEPENGYLLSYYELEDIMGVQMPKNTVYEVASTVKSKLDKLSERYGKRVVMHHNFYNNLKALCTIDFKTAQADRWQNNLNFEIVYNGAFMEINVAPMFDNEAVFGFVEVKAFYQEHKEYFDSIFSGENTDVQEFIAFFNLYIAESLKEIRPQFGMVQTVNFDSCKSMPKDMKWVGDGKFASFANKQVCSDIVLAMGASDKYKDFCDGLQFDAESFSDCIKMETEGFKIPPQFLFVKPYITQKAVRELFANCFLKNI